MSATFRRVVIGAPIVFVVVATIGAVGQYYSDRKGPSAKPLGSVELRHLAARHGLLMGTAVDDGALQHEPGYRQDLARQFDALTPENAMKWDALEPTRGSLDWAGADRAVAFARRHRMSVRGHTLIWHSQLPGWITHGHFRAPQLRRLMARHIATVMGRYRGRVRTWDVVNEIVSDTGHLRHSVWSRTLGPPFVAEAFAAARRADPHARLAINEIGAESMGPKSDLLLKIVKTLKARGLVDEVGFQAHFTLDGVPATMRTNLQRFAALGVDIAITEADVRLRDDPTAEQLAAQGTAYRDLVATCRSVPRCRAITVWGFTDRHSWIDDTQPGYGSATLLDDELKPKPAFRAFASALQAP